MRQLTLLMTEKLLCREAEQLASDCVMQWLMVRTKLANCIFSSWTLFPFTSDRFFLLPKWVSPSLETRRSPGSGTLTASWAFSLSALAAWTVEATAGTKRRDPCWKSVNASATSQLSHRLWFTVTAQSPALTLLSGHKGGPAFVLWNRQFCVSQECSSVGQGYKMPAASAGWRFCITAITLSPLVTLQAIENIDTLANLDSLFLGKNKITKLQNLDALTNLTVLSIQVLIVLCTVVFWTALITWTTL